MIATFLSHSLVGAVHRFPPRVVCEMRRDAGQGFAKFPLGTDRRGVDTGSIVAKAWGHENNRRFQIPLRLRSLRFRALLARSRRFRFRSFRPNRSRAEPRSAPGGTRLLHSARAGGHGPLAGRSRFELPLAVSLPRSGERARRRERVVGGPYIRLDDALNERVLDATIGRALAARKLELGDLAILVPGFRRAPLVREAIEKGEMPAAEARAFAPRP